MKEKSDNFFGSSSSEQARNAYVPIRDVINSPTGNVTLGLNTSSVLKYDPKLFLFTLAKYKFAGKILANFEQVLEIGCMDGTGSLLLASFVNHLTSIDFYKPHLQDATQYVKPHISNVNFIGMDFLESGFNKEFNGCVCFDVLEHIDKLQEDIFLAKICDSLHDDGVAVIGFPSLESQAYASPVNKTAHINCKTQKDGLTYLKQYFTNVFPFSMNDEVLHTGYGPMSQYLLFICVQPKRV